MRKLTHRINLSKSTHSTKRLFSTTNYYSYIEDSKALLDSNQVKLYEAPEWQEISSILMKANYFNIVPNTAKNIELMYSRWKDCVFQSSFKPKYFALLPLMVEDRQTLQAKKKFVLEMSFLPSSKAFRVQAAMISGVHTFLEPLEDLVPIPPEDFRFRHRVLRSRPADFIDGDMFYANRKTLNVLCFDKSGSWFKEGLEHKMLQVGESYSESSWFDHLNWEGKWF